MSILFFNRCVSPQVDPFTSTFARSFITSSQRCCFIRLQVAFVFPTLPPFCFYSRTKISSSSIHFIDGKFLHSFPSMLLPGGFYEDALLVHHSSLSFFFCGTNSSFVDRILSSFQMPSHTGAPHNNSLLTIHLFRRAQAFSKGSSCHSRSIQPISRLLSHSSHLIQPVHSLF